ncbi:hypothetical protein QNO07_04730 [Streptomyces sp. 549]|uniref:hypothetical protein n=1 Tax=Streptomyces sp. 549 TaxID=3049076 RepID=UPI0024C3F10C|nr:hypothetical protein [Streptomyces sp. 549]MDK1472738.1 hypothetical protein [Streptomyces sp. 549]
MTDRWGLEIVRDAARDEVGVIVVHGPVHVVLRPIGGGPHWQAALTDIGPVTRPELLRAKVRDLNQRSTRGRP